MKNPLTHKEMIVGIPNSRTAAQGAAGMVLLKSLIIIIIPASVLTREGGDDAVAPTIWESSRPFGSILRSCEKNEEGTKKEDV